MDVPGGLIATVNIDFKTFAVIAASVVFLAILAYRLMRRDDNVRRTRYGFFIERDRYEEGVALTGQRDSDVAPTGQQSDTHEVVPGDESTKVEWPRREGD